MKVFVDPIPKLGLAMRRCSMALRQTCPTEFTVVDDPSKADLQVLHAVDQNVLKWKQAPLYAVMHHCLDYMADPAGNGDNIPIPEPEAWDQIWKDALVVWAYYDLLTRFTFPAASTCFSKNEHVKGAESGPHFYMSPLGVDGTVFQKTVNTRPNTVLTTGYVSGPRAEAIEECALAAAAAGGNAVHLGPSDVGGMTQRPVGWYAVSGISDTELAQLYGKTKYVSGLRHGEGFELPVLEGLACGSRPVCFDLPIYRYWFANHAIFVPESSGQELVDTLTQIFRRPPAPVLPTERDNLLRAFNWGTIASGFWRALSAQVEAKAKPVSVAPSVVVMVDGVRKTKQEVIDATLEAIPGAIAMDKNGIRKALTKVLKDIPRAGQNPLSDGTHLKAGPTITMPSQKRPVLWIGDSPSTDWTGFGRASRYIIDEVRKDYDVTVIGTTHDGHPYDRTKMPYDIWPMSAGIGEVITRVRPSAIVIQHDPWIVKGFLEQTGNVPVIAALAIDGKNCRCDYLNGLDLAIFWTDFAEKEARAGGYAGPSKVIPLGVDLDIYKPFGDKRTALAQIGLGAAEELVDAFIVGYICRNQPRKRLDLAVRHFSEWVKSRHVTNAYLYIQTGPTGESSYDVQALMAYERLSNRLIHVEQGYRKVYPEGRLAFVYRALDLFWSTTQGEGFGLPALEAMACGTPCALPDWSGYGDWASPAAHLVRCGDISGTLNWPGSPRSGVKIAVLGGVPALDADVEALDRIYRDREYRNELRDKGLALAADDRYRWPVIGQAYSAAIREVLEGPFRMRLRG